MRAEIFPGTLLLTAAAAVVAGEYGYHLAQATVLDWAAEKPVAEWIASEISVSGGQFTEGDSDLDAFREWQNLGADPYLDASSTEATGWAATMNHPAVANLDTTNGALDFATNMPQLASSDGPYESFVFIAPTKSFIHQIVSIGLELHQRGHRVTFVSHDGLRRKMRAQFETVSRNMRNQSIEIIEVGEDSDRPFTRAPSPAGVAANEAAGNRIAGEDAAAASPHLDNLMLQDTAWYRRWSTVSELMLLLRSVLARFTHNTLKYWRAPGWDILHKLNQQLLWKRNKSQMRRGSRQEIGAIMAQYDQSFEAILTPFQELLQAQQSAGGQFDSAHSKLNHCFNPRNRPVLYNTGKRKSCWPLFTSSLFVIPGPWDFALKFCQNHNLPHVLILTTPLFANLYSYPVYMAPLYGHKPVSPSRVLRMARQQPTFTYRFNNMLWSMGQLLHGSLIPNISPNLYRAKPTLRLTLSIPPLLPLRFHPPLTVFTGPVVSPRRQRPDFLTPTVRAALDARRHRNAIYISLGTMAVIDPTDLNKLVEAFLPTIQDDWTVVWAMSSKLQAEITTENAKLIAAAAPNFIIEPWVETPAILTHPGVKLFVSHCGANGYHEALASGVPILGIPLHGDQPFNCAAAEATIKNVVCFAIEETSSLTLRKFAREILNKPSSNPQIQNAIRMKTAISKAYNGMENVIKWLETAAVLKGDFKFLQTPPEELGVFRGYNLDIALVVVIVSVVLFTGFLLMVSSSRSRSPSIQPQQSFPRKKKYYKTF